MLLAMAGRDDPSEIIERARTATAMNDIGHAYQEENRRKGSAIDSIVQALA